MPSVLSGRNLLDCRRCRLRRHTSEPNSQSASVFDDVSWFPEEGKCLGGRVNGPNDPYYARHGVEFVEPNNLRIEKPK